MKSSCFVLFARYIALTVSNNNTSMKHLLYIGLIFIGIISCSKKDNPTNSTTFDCHSFSSTSYSEDGKIKIISTLENSIISQERYLNDSILLERTDYYRDSSFFYTTKLYNTEGCLITSHNVQNGLLNGEAYIYYLDGTILTETNFKNNFRDGICKSYHPNGNIRSVIEYNMGEIIYYRNYDDQNIIKEEKHSMSVKFDLLSHKDKLTTNINIHFGGLDYLNEESYFGYIISKVAIDTTDVDKNRDVLINSRDTTLTLHVENNDKYLLGIGFSDKELSFKSFSSMSFEIKNDSINVNIFEKEITEYWETANESEIAAIKEYYKIVGKDFPQ